MTIPDESKDLLLRAASVTAQEQCKCGHAGDQHAGEDLDGLCKVEPCVCLYYESWVTPEMELANAVRIRDQNAGLFGVALGALEEVRALVGEWEVLVKDFGEVGAPVISKAIERCRLPLEAIVERFDAAVKEQIK